jgi:glyoxylase-like metal-dependent hydrolase (beta-lactamase superfamily II)
MTVDQQTTVNAIDARQLYEKLLSDTPIFILDVRNEQDFERWHVEGRANVATLNLPYYDFLEDEAGSIARVSRDREVLVICAKEGSSQYVAELLAENGIAASYLSNGIASWGNYYDVRDIANNEHGRIVQIARPARGDLSFAIISAGEAILIDPLRNTAFYRDLIAQAGARLTGIFETHVHADHISGGPALARETGADYYVHPYDAIHPIDMLPARMDYLPLGDGQRFTIGKLEMRVIWYPGHTLGQVNFLLREPTGKRYLFSGDGIFLRSFGRPDLGGKGETWTPVLYESMYERLPQHIDDETMILPAHFSGLNEDTGNGIFAASYGEVRERNELIQPRTPEDFYEFVINHLPVFPQEYIEIKRVNIGLSNPTEEQAQELELGKNICALSG